MGTGAEPDDTLVDLKIRTGANDSIEVKVFSATTITDFKEELCVGAGAEPDDTLVNSEIRTGADDAIEVKTFSATAITDFEEEHLVGTGAEPDDTLVDPDIGTGADDALEVKTASATNGKAFKASLPTPAILCFFNSKEKKTAFFPLIIGSFVIPCYSFRCRFRLFSQPVCS